MARRRAGCSENGSVILLHLQTLKQGESEGQNQESTKALGLTIRHRCWRATDETASCESSRTIHSGEAGPFASGVCEYTASRGAGAFSGSASRHPRPSGGQERRRQLTTTTIARNAINDGSTRGICVPCPGPFPALGRAIMAQRYAGSGCVNGSSWSGAIGRSCLASGRELRGRSGSTGGPRPTRVRAARVVARRLALDASIRLLTLR